MKIILLLAFLASSALSAFAQIEKKNVLIGGSFGFATNATSHQYGSSSNANIQPNIQFAYGKNRTIGFGLDLVYALNESDDNDTRQENFAVAPTINFNQYYPIKGAFGWMLQEYAGLSFQSLENRAPGQTTTTSKGTSIFAGITPGLYYAIGEKKNWLLQANVGNLGISYYKQSNSDFHSVQFNTNLFQSYRFGFAYIFRK